MQIHKKSVCPSHLTLQQKMYAYINYIFEGVQQKNMVLKHWILPIDHFKTHLFFF